MTLDFETRELLADVHFMKWWAYQLPPVLEHRFTFETDPERNRQIRFWVLVWLGFSWLTLILDILTVPGIWPLALGLRLFLITPVAAGSFWLLSSIRSGPLTTLGSVAVPAASLLSVLTVFAAANPYDGFRAGMVLSLGLLATNVLFPVRFRDTLVFTGVTLAAGLAINAAATIGHHAKIGHWDVVSAGLLLAVISILARFAAERDSRHSFMAGLKLQIRNEQLERSNESLLRMSNTDPLTGLANRRFFDRTMDEAWAEGVAARSWIAVMMIDVDQFKLFNDAAGHLEGDRCLTIVARAIAEHVRVGFDMAARFGGEEFVVLMPVTELAVAREVAQRVHTAIGALQVFHPGRVGESFVSVSIGCAALRLDTSGHKPADLLAVADAALYAAKTAGRNRIVAAEV